MISILVLLTACAQTEEVVYEPQKPIPVSSESRIETEPLLRLLSVRDQGPPCSTLIEFSDQLQTDLMRIVQDSPKPPWAPMRAANCLIELYPLESKAEFVRWMQSEDTMGLALLLSNQMSILPAELAPDLVSVGLNGPHNKKVRPRILKLNEPRLNILVDAD